MKVNIYGTLYFAKKIGKYPRYQAEPEHRRVTMDFLSLISHSPCSWEGPGRMTHDIFGKE
jgi:hypothetical protein